MSKNLSEQEKIEVEQAIQGSTGKINKEIDSLKNLTIFVVIVLFIGFALAFITIGGFLQSYLAYRQATYQDLVDKVNKQNTEIELLIQQVQNKK